MIRKWFNARAMTSAQPIRRARRPSHGAAAVSAAVVAPSPTEVGKPAAVSGPRESVTVTVVVPEIGSKPSKRTTSTAAIAAPSPAVPTIRHPPERTAMTSPPTSTTTASRRVTITMTSTNQVGIAARPAKSSPVKSTSARPHSHCTSSSTRSRTAATTARRTSEGERTTVHQYP